MIGVGLRGERVLLLLRSLLLLLEYGMIPGDPHWRLLLCRGILLL